MSFPNTQFLLLFFLFDGSLIAFSFNFNFTRIDPGKVISCKKGTDGICPQGDTTIQNDGVIQLTRISGTMGRAFYSDPIAIWHKTTRELTDFTSNFSFIINATDSRLGGMEAGGLAFFLSSYPSTIPSDGGGDLLLGLFDRGTSLVNSSKQIVAVELDTLSDDDRGTEVEDKKGHIGINVNSAESMAVAEWNTSAVYGRKGYAWVRYNSTTYNLSVTIISYGKSGPETIRLSYIVDLTKILPEQVAVGFSASNLQSDEVHAILSWSFKSSLRISNSNSKTSRDMKVTAYAVSATIFVIGGVILAWQLKRSTEGNTNDDIEHDDGDEDTDSVDGSIDGEIDKGKGPRRFQYKQLVQSTNNFSEDRRIGEGGFGSVYKGLLEDANVDVAIKRISKTSKHRKKDFTSEVKIISRLRHRNLVPLIGWCHNHSELLLVYELETNGSLDSILFQTANDTMFLTWNKRYKIALGLASALYYLHEECDPSIVHRDVKSCNVMLGADCTAKLGDFGLARFVDHNRGPPNTILAGTMGYMAPECVITGRASKESDVYSFGVVALEIACGRRSIDLTTEGEVIGVLEWAWSLYRKGSLIGAMDQRLVVDLELDKTQVERLLLVGLWCANPDVKLRPSIRQAYSTLNMESPPPNLRVEMPDPFQCSPSMQIEMFKQNTTNNTMLDTN